MRYATSFWMLRIGQNFGFVCKNMVVMVVMVMHRESVRHLHLTLKRLAYKLTSRTVYGRDRALKGCVVPCNHIYIAMG